MWHTSCKKDGGVRPIACNELLYRVAAKAILKQHFKQSILPKGQVGVGTPGGIKVVIEAVERWYQVRVNSGMSLVWISQMHKTLSQ